MHNLIEENERRNVQPEYNPKSGLGSFGERKEVHIKELGTLYLPLQFVSLPWVRKIIKIGSLEDYCINTNGLENSYTEVLRKFIKTRAFYDCEFWLSSFVKIKAKGKPGDMLLKPSEAQRIILYAILKDWYDEKPVRLILVKCRQLGGSTIITMFMLWVQIMVFKQWNSAICGDVEMQANTIRSMQDKFLKNYPIWMTDNDSQLSFSPFEGSQKTKRIDERDCVFSVGSMQRPDNIRSVDIMASHNTEVGLWKKTEGKTPEDLIQSIKGSIDEIPYTFFGMESTAKGTGNYFYQQWVEAKAGRNELTPIFVPWFKVDRYNRKITRWDEFKDKFYSDNYYLYLWNEGATLEQINWYMNKQLTMEKWRLNSEFPSNDIEAFQSTGKRVFTLDQVETMRKMCNVSPVYVGDIGADSTYGKDALKDIQLTKTSKCLRIWAQPDLSEKVRDRYLVVVDIGGTSEKADYSVITVIDRYEQMYNGCPEIVAEWYGHIDHDQLAWRAAQIATYYDKALLVIESNTLETEYTEGDHFQYILSEISDYYDNLYSRTSEEKIKQGAPVKYGFHTNKSTKTSVVDFLKKALRDVLYYERSLEACSEYDVFELKDDGTFGAADKCHDDLVMTRAIGLFVCYNEMDLPKLQNNYDYKRKKVTKSTI